MLCVRRGNPRDLVVTVPHNAMVQPGVAPYNAANEDGEDLFHRDWEGRSYFRPLYLEPPSSPLSSTSPSCHQARSAG